MSTHRHSTRGARHQSGFSMIEVLVAIVILALGLLGFALLQTMSLRFSQSANHRTQATNLAYDLLDQMRANRYQAAWYTGSGGASFTDGQAVAAACGAANWGRVTGQVTIAQSVDRWKCQVVDVLGPSATTNVTYNSGVVQVDVSWGDQRWDRTAPDAKTTFSLQSRL